MWRMSAEPIDVMSLPGADFAVAIPYARRPLPPGGLDHDSVIEGLTDVTF
jgi:hypothetical protein